MLIERVGDHWHWFHGSHRIVRSVLEEDINPPEHRFALPGGFLLVRPDKEEPSRFDGFVGTDAEFQLLSVQRSPNWGGPLIGHTFAFDPSSLIDTVRQAIAAGAIPQLSATTSVHPSLSIEISGQGLLDLEFSYSEQGILRLTGWHIEKGDSDTLLGRTLIDQGMIKWIATYREEFLGNASDLPEAAKLVIAITEPDGDHTNQHYRYTKVESALAPVDSLALTPGDLLANGQLLGQLHQFGVNDGIQYEWRDGVINPHIPTENLGAIRTLAAAVNGNEWKEQPPLTGSSIQPYCGLYCAAFVAFARDVDFDFRAFLTSEHISGPAGSSLAQLQDVLATSGISTAPAHAITSSFLRNAPVPVLLHLRSEPWSTNRDHFVLHIRADGDKTALLFDPAHGLRAMSYGELAAREGNVGLLVGTGGVSFSDRFSILHLLLAVALGCAVYSGRRVYASPPHHPLVVGLVITVVASCSAFLWILWGRDGVYDSPEGRTFVSLRFIESDLPSLGWKDFASDDIPVDARLGDAYERGHLPQAINYSVNAAIRNEPFQVIHDNRRLVVYCQHSLCNFDAIVAMRLRRLGYRNLALYEGGWDDWIEHGEP